MVTNGFSRDGRAMNDSALHDLVWRRVDYESPAGRAD
jgi:hypothetical protein